MTKPAWFMWSILICGTVVARAEPPVLSLETIFHPKKAVDFDGPALPHTQWLPDGRLAIREGKQWQVLEPQTGEQKAWELPDQLATALKDLPDVNDETIERAVSSLSTTSDDGKRFLVRLGKGLAMYDLETKAAKWLNKNASEWPLAKLSPDGSKIGFSRDGNLFVYDINAGTTTQLTQDGSDQLLNGQLDWVYQEEVYGRGQFRSFWFSPDSKRIAYLKLDQSPVPTWILDNTTTKRQSLEHTRYPRSGDPIPSVQLWVSQVDSLRSAVRVDEPSEPEMLIVRVTWRPNGELYYQVQDRRQRWLELYRYSVGKKTNTRVLREDTGAWQEPLLEPLWQADGSFLWMSDRADGYRHLYRVDARGQLTALTRGAWNVWQLESVAAKEPYAIVTGSDQAGERAAYRIRTDRFEEPLRVTTSPGTHSVSVSKDGRWIIDNYSRASEPASLWLMPTDQGLKNETNAEAKVRQFGKPEETPWKTLGLRGPKFEFLEIEPGLKLPIQIYSPESDLLDDGQDKKYPVLIHTYAGPLAPAAVDRWQGQNGLWHQWLANQGVVVVLVDVRSSAGRGPKDTWPIYGRMGEDELKDLEAIVDRLAERTWFDAKRVGIWGWSYGGFFASYVLTHSDKFRCGIAGAPVTDWRNYDAIYTERYMNLPKDNESGYKSTSVVEAAANLKQPLLIIHGGMDDNVHPHNTWQLVHEVMNHGGPIQPLFFPTSRHAVHDPMQRYWMYQRMSEFLLRELRE